MLAFVLRRNPGVIDEPLGRLMSLNVALFASVLLASRLSTSSEVFAFLFFGIEWVCLFLCLLICLFILFILFLCLSA